MVNRLIYLVVCSWKMFYEVRWDKPVLKVSISRLWLFIPVTLWVSWASINQQHLSEKMFAFSFLLLMLEVYRITNRCGLDLVHLYYLNIRFYEKYVLLALIEVVGPAFFVLLGFLLLHIALETWFLALLVWLYLTFVCVKLAFGLLSNRYLQVTVIYLWLLILSCAIAGGMAGLIGSDRYQISVFLDHNLRCNFKSILDACKFTSLALLLIGCGIVYFKFKVRPFVDPHSLPKRLL